MRNGWKGGIQFMQTFISAQWIYRPINLSNQTVWLQSMTIKCCKTVINSMRPSDAYIICVGKVTIICSDNGLSPGRRQAIIWNSPAIMLIGPLGTSYFIRQFSFKNMHLKMLSGKWCPFGFGLNVLKSVAHFRPPTVFVTDFILVCQLSVFNPLDYHTVTKRLITQNYELGNTCKIPIIRKVLTGNIRIHGSFGHEKDNCVVLYNLWRR